MSPPPSTCSGRWRTPGRVRYQLVGVGDGRVAEHLASVLAAAGAERAWVVHGDDGLDELSTTAPSRVFEWRPGNGRHPQLCGRPGGTRFGASRPGRLEGR